MPSYQSLARNARGYGDDFNNRAMAIAGTIGIPVDWLLAIIALETTDFAAAGPPWGGRNPLDHGAGIIGFTGADGGAWERMTPTEQLDLLPNYFTRCKTPLEISTFRSPIEAYFMVRAPWGLLMAPEDTGVQGLIDWGGQRGKQPATRQDVVNIATRIFTSHGLTWTLPTYGVEGQWMVRIGSWLGQFVFLSDGYAWYSTIKDGGPGSPGFGGAMPEVAFADRHYGHWECVDGTVSWRFGPRDDIRRWSAQLEAPGNGTRWEVLLRPVGQGAVKMWRGSPEPA